MLKRVQTRIVRFRVCAHRHLFHCILHQFRFPDEKASHPGPPALGGVLSSYYRILHSCFSQQRSAMRLSMLLWTQDTCNPLPNFESTWVPIGSGIKFDPLVPDSPVMKAPEPM